jgi:RND family efflux transporter MFP subunit
MSLKNKLLKIVLPIVIIIAGFAGMQVLVLSRPSPKKEVRETPGVLVEVRRMKKEKRPVVVIGTGTVQPRREANISPQVGGVVTSLAPNFIAGGFFQKGDLLFNIEDTDYRLAIDRANAALAAAAYELATVTSQAKIARGEWERLKLEEKSEPNPLVLYEPQLKNARASVESASAAVKQAEIDLSRTAVYAPFDCLVRSEEIDLGQYVTAGRSVAAVAGTDTAEIVVALPLEELSWLSVPRGGSDEKGSPAKVQLPYGDGLLTWEGRVVRSLGEVDIRDRMARVVVAVDDPYNRKKGSSNERPSLEIGTFVDVEITGKELSGVFVVPRSALRDKSTLWTMDDEGKLRTKPVNVLRRERETLIIRKGLEEGDLVVLTYISGAAEGIALRVAGEEEAK